MRATGIGCLLGRVNRANARLTDDLDTLGEVVADSPTQRFGSRRRRRRALLVELPFHLWLGEDGAALASVFFRHERLWRRHGVGQAGASAQ
jgi:hypothetical protein